MDIVNFFDSSCIEILENVPLSHNETWNRLRAEKLVSPNIAGIKIPFELSKTAEDNFLSLDSKFIYKDLAADLILITSCSKEYSVYRSHCGLTDIANSTSPLTAILGPEISEHQLCFDNLEAGAVIQLRGYIYVFLDKALKFINSTLT